MINKKTIALVTAGALFSAFSVNAAGTYHTNSNASDQVSTGFYVNGQLGYAWDSKEHDFKEAFDKAKKDNPSDLDLWKFSSDGFAGRLAAGFRFNQYIAAEGGFTYLPETKITGPLKADPTKKGTAKMTFWVIDVSAKGMMPVNDQFFVTASAGPALYHVTAKKSDVVEYVEKDEHKESMMTFRMGAGLGYNFAPDMAVVAEFGYYFGPKKDDFRYPSFSVLTAGIQYSFS